MNSTSTPERVAQILSGRVPLTKSLPYLDNPSIKWVCPCGHHHWKICKAPVTVQCHYCHRIYTVFNPKEIP